jgi:hypothetical protein
LEEEYFPPQQVDRGRERARRGQAKLSQAERAHLKALHFLCCPNNCGMSLEPVILHGVHLDRCYSSNGQPATPGGGERNG